MMSFGKHESREWALDEAAAEPIVKRAVEGGIIFFDTADVYNGGQSEVVTGNLLRKLFGMREEYVVATKVNGRTMPGENGRGLSRKHVMASIDGSLERLGLDYVDLYQIHRWDDSTPIEETMEALHDVVKAGKARYIGASSMRAWQFAKAQRVAATPFVSMQNHYNLIYREEEREMIPQCLDQGIGIVPWSPLARGLLARSPESSEERATTRGRADAAIGALADDSITWIDTDAGDPAALDRLSGGPHGRGRTGVAVIEAARDGRRRPRDPRARRLPRPLRPPPRRPRRRDLDAPHRDLAGRRAARLRRRAVVRRPPAARDRERPRHPPLQRRHRRGRHVGHHRPPHRRVRAPGRDRRLQPDPARRRRDRLRDDRPQEPGLAVRHRRRPAPRPRLTDPHPRAALHRRHPRADALMLVGTEEPSAPPSTARSRGRRGLRRRLWG